MMVGRASYFDPWTFRHTDSAVYGSTDPGELCDDDDVLTVFIARGHKTGYKNVWMEEERYVYIKSDRPR